MRKFILLFAIGLTASFNFTFAQSEYNYSAYVGYYNLEIAPINYKPAKPVKQIQFTEIKKNCKKKVYLKKIHPNGKISEYYQQNKSNDFIPVIKIEYDSLFGNKSKVEHFDKKGQIKSTNTYSYLSEFKPLLVESINSKGEIVERDTWIYNDNGKVSKSMTYSKNLDKEKYSWLYTYNDKGEKSKTSFYKNGKLKHEWSFECNEKGIKLEKQNDVTQICRWSESEDGYILKVYQSFDEHGKLAKYITKFTTKDTLIVEHLIYNTEDELTNRTTYDKNVNRPILYERFKDNKLVENKNYKYDKGNLIITEFYKNNNLKSREEYTYNQDNLLVKYKKYKNNCRLIKNFELEYPTN